MYRVSTAFLAVASIVLGLSSPTMAMKKTVTSDDISVGFFYSTFNESPNLVLLAGGRAEDFCAANPDDPFNAQPAEVPAQISERPNGTIKIRVNEPGQPIHLYDVEADDAPAWITQACAAIDAGQPAPKPLASGSARLVVRDRVVSDNLAFVFNSVQGRMLGADGTKYRVRAKANLTIESGAPVGNPEDFVDLKLTEIKQRR